MARCWSCGHNAMCPFESLGKGWLKCADCGATEQSNPSKLGAATMTVRKDATHGGTKFEPRVRRKRKAQT